MPIMTRLLRLISKMPLPKGTKLAWQRPLLDRAYLIDIAIAQKAKNKEKVLSLEASRRFEIEMHDEEEDAHVTQQLLKKARRLRVPVPHRYNEDKSESEHWCEGRYFGSWNLTNRGIASLREEIRRELKARHELRSHWIVWVSALTGLVGTITGLVALMAQKNL
jgi:hypothetical protein